MASPPKRIYWDACAWIAFIQKEKILTNGKVVEDRERMCRTVLEAANRGMFEIVTSALSYVEVCKKPKIRDEANDRISAFFEHDYILPINLDRYVGERARELMLGPYSKLKPLDAVHLASAALSDCEEMHSFDEKLLALNGQIGRPDGTMLKICKPSVGGPPAPLLDEMENN